jgi:hypothetical protein
MQHDYTDHFQINTPRVTMLKIVLYMTHIAPQALITELTNSMHTCFIPSKPQIMFVVIIQITIIRSKSTIWETECLFIVLVPKSRVRGGR